MKQSRFDKGDRKSAIFHPCGLFSDSIDSMTDEKTRHFFNRDNSFFRRAVSLLKLIVVLIISVEFKIISSTQTSVQEITLQQTDAGAIA